MAGDSDNRRTEHISHKFSRCGSGDNLIAECPKPPKHNKKQRKQFRFSERGNRALQK